MRSKPLFWALALVLLLPVAAAAAERAPVQGMPLQVLDRSQPKVSRSQREMIEFDLRSRIERTAPVSPYSGPELRTEGHDGVAERMQGAVPKDFIGVSLVSDPTVGIYPRHVRLEMDFVGTNGQMKTYSCSGTLIDPTHVITAAHCVYMWDDEEFVVNDWAQAVRVYPGYDNGAGPIGVAGSTQLRSWTGWTQDQDYDSDIALVTLDRAVGVLAGWRGIASTANWDFFDDELFASYGYPGTDVNDVPVYDTERMYFHVGDYDYDDDPQIGFDYSAFHGTSGSGSINGGAVYAIRSHFEYETLFGEIVGSDTYDTRLTASRVSTILGWIADDRPNSPDLSVLDVTADVTGTLAGQPISGLDFLVHNYSEASFSGTVPYTIYLSTDQVIDPSDAYVYDSSWVGTIAPNGSVRLNVSSAAAVPLGLASGDYYVAVVLNLSDANPSNNDTAPDDMLLFNVQCGLLAPPVLANPENGHPCVPTTVTLAWGSSGPGVTYHLRVSGGGEVRDYFTTSTQLLVEDLAPGKTYFWQVRAQPPCGGWGNWALYFAMTTEGDLDNVVLTEPDGGSTCESTTLPVSWTQKPTADMYRVQVTEIGGSTYVVDVPGTSTTLTGLSAGAKYQLRVKARNECLEWGSYGPRTVLYTRAAAGEAATPLSPSSGQATLGDVVLQSSVSFSGQNWEYELETAGGTPVFSGQGAWTQEVGPLAEDDYRWRVRMSSCTASGEQWGPWSGWADFEVDLTPPSFTSLPQVSPQSVGQWSSQNLVNVSWDFAQDNCCVESYRYLFDTSPSTDPGPGNPDATVVFDVPNASVTLPDGEYWFHLVAVDFAGNVSAPVHVGPIRIDTLGPAAPVLSGPVPSGDWTNAEDLQVEWEPSTDAGSGVVGYSLTWTSNDPDPFVDTTELSAIHTSIPEGFQSFRVRGVDAAGNAGTIASYNVNVDRQPPNVTIFQPQTGQVLQSTSTFNVDYNSNDNAIGPRWLDHEHEYSVDGGASWYHIASCRGNGGGGGGGGNGPGCGGGGGGGGWQGNYFWQVPWAPPGSTAIYRLTAIDPAGNRSEAISGEFFIVATTGVELPEITHFELMGNHPNPFNPRTTIAFALPEEVRVDLEIFDLQGRKVRTLVSEVLGGPQQHEVSWDGIDDRGDVVASGVYVYRLRAGDHTSTRRMTLLK